MGIEEAFAEKLPPTGPTPENSSGKVEAPALVVVKTEDEAQGVALFDADVEGGTPPPAAECRMSAEAKSEKSEPAFAEFCVVAALTPSPVAAPFSKRGRIWGCCGAVVAECRVCVRNRSC